MGSACSSSGRRPAVSPSEAPMKDWMQDDRWKGMPAVTEEQANEKYPVHRRTEEMAAAAECGLMDGNEAPLLQGVIDILVKQFSVPMAALTVLLEDVQYFRVKHGLGVCTPLKQSFCRFVAAGGRPLVVKNALKDERFKENPLVVGAPHIRSYLGVPFVIDGLQMGALCVIDTKPRNWSDDDVKFMGLLSKVISGIVDVQKHEHRVTAVARSLGTHCYVQYQSLTGEIVFASPVLAQFMESPHLVGTRVDQGHEAMRRRIPPSKGMSEWTKIHISDLRGIFSGLEVDETMRRASTCGTPRAESGQAAEEGAFGVVDSSSESVSNRARGRAHSTEADPVPSSIAGEQAPKFDPEQEFVHLSVVVFNTRSNLLVLRLPQKRGEDTELTEGAPMSPVSGIEPTGAGASSAGESAASVPRGTAQEDQVLPGAA